jgi:hypothetical protein
MCDKFNCDATFLWLSSKTTESTNHRCIIGAYRSDPAIALCLTGKMYIYVGKVA